MRRRLLCAVALLWVTTAAPALAEDIGNLPLVGWLRIDTPATDGAQSELRTLMFREALANIGRVDGRNLRVVSRSADGQPERFPALAQALVRDGPSVIVPFGEAATRAAQSATSTIPIVALADDFIGAGLVTSLARPGGNTTGVSLLAPEVDVKKLEMLKEILPSAQRFGILNDPDTSTPERLQVIRTTGERLGVELLVQDARRAADLDDAFAALARRGAEAVNILTSPMLSGSQERIGELLARYRLPAICQIREMAMATGCIASYGNRRSESLAQLAAAIDKVLKGPPPGDILVQQATNLALMINARAARALGIEIPPALLARADEVID